MSQVPDSRGRVLLVEEDWEIEAAILFRDQRRRAIRFRRDLRSVEEQRWQRSGNLLDSDHDAKHRDRRCPRPYASHP